MRKLITLLLAFLSLNLWAAPELSPEAEVTILTCEPGTDLYSVFGHSAIRINDPGRVDVVYNYGTFDFGSDFYLKFARGKLNYRLSRSNFANFNYEYIVTERAVWEQVLDLTPEEKQRFFDLLEDNYLPENRYYLYDFFFDNCATRVRDMLKETLGDDLEFRSTFQPDSITFREMIDEYLVDQHWSDFGIDIALGLPCDAKMQEEENMFLPDYIFSEFETAVILSGSGSRPLVKATREVLPVIEREPAFGIDGSLILTIVIALLAMVHFFRVRSGKTVKYGIPRLVLIFLGLIGVGVFLLWFATDHVATKPNLNLLWAFPLHLIIAFMLKKSATWKYLYFRFFLFTYVVLLFFGIAFPQGFHPSFYPLFLAGVFTMARMLLPDSGKTV